MANMVRKHRDINPDGFAIYYYVMRYTCGAICLRREKEFISYRIRATRVYIAIAFVQLYRVCKANISWMLLRMKL